MRFTATEATNRFGSHCAQAKRGSMLVEKAGQIDTVSLLAEHYQALQADHDKAHRAAREKAFEAEFGDWIAAQNARFEAHGSPGADLRPWCAADGRVRRLRQPRQQRRQRHALRGRGLERPARRACHAVAHAAG